MIVEKRCGNCRSELKFLKRENIQLGKTSFLFGDWPNLLSGAQDLEFWVCPNCRKLELFVPETVEEFEYEEGAIAQVTCLVCGAEYDMDDPKCPRCGAKNTTIF